MDLKKIIREIPDFPIRGISFKDITTLLKEKDCFHYTINKIVKNFRDFGITKVIGIEARGFILGGAIANELKAGFIPVRKSGKLPAEKIVEIYDLEYGTDKVEMHADALTKNDIVLIHDDLLATGGTALAVLNMVNKLGIKNVYFCFICDLEFIKTKPKEIIKEYNPYILVKYQE